MPRTIHRTAVLTLHNPTRHARAALDRAFRHYTAAYTECLHACERQYDAPTLLSLASYRWDSHSGKPVMNARTLAKRLFSAEAAPVVARTYAAAAAPLEGRLRQSLREHVAQTLLSYAMLYQAWSQHGSTRMARGNGEAPGEEEEAAETTPLRAAVEGSASRFPSRLRQSDLTPTLHTALAQLAQLADNRVREREVIAQLQRTRQAETVAIPFVGVAAAYGCGLYLNRETNRFYARLDIVGSSSHLGHPITARGRYVDLKTGILTVSEGSEDQRALPEAATFGRGCKSILVPLEMGRWHEEAQRWSVLPGAPDVAMLPVAYLPQRGDDPRQPEAATPVSAQLVRHADHRRAGGYRYELHVAFSMPAPKPEIVLPPHMRPLLAINRGIRHLYAAVVATPDASCALDVQVTSGKELLALQQAHEHARQARQQRGVWGRKRTGARGTPHPYPRPATAADRRSALRTGSQCDRRAGPALWCAGGHGGLLAPQ